LENVDNVDYALSEVIKASNGLLGGLWFTYGPFRIVMAGKIAISMKHGVADPYERTEVYKTGLKASDLHACNFLSYVIIQGSHWGRSLLRVPQHHDELASVDPAL